MVLQSVIEECLTGLGYELVDVEHGPGGLLRVFIDFPYGAAMATTSAGEANASEAAAGSVTDAQQTSPAPVEPQIRIEDCERVSHQLTHLLTVEGIDYSRLEVSSPGLDRPLRKPADFERFAGCDVALRLKRPFEGRRNYEGRLTVEGEGRFGIEYSDAPAEPAGAARKGAGKRAGVKRVAGKAARKPATPVPTHKMVFELDEIDRARLVPAFRF